MTVPSVPCPPIRHAPLIGLKRAPSNSRSNLGRNQKRIERPAEMLVVFPSKEAGMQLTTTEEQRTDATELELLDRYWRAANYLSVGQIYLLDNPLLKQPLSPAHIKPRLLGHWGTTPGLNF